METRAAKVAGNLLKINAVKLNPGNPFTWASGLRSPIYCDNRVTLSYPDVRRGICEAFVSLQKEQFAQADAVAGVATAGIAHGALLAEALDLPFIYVRSAPKKHGLNNRIEGRLEPGRRYLVVEDLVSTGGSSLEAVEAVREAGAEVAGLVCIFTYGFQKAFDAFASAGVPWAALCDLEALLHKAVEINYIQPADLEVLKTWRQNPEAWSASVMKTQNL